MSTELKPCPFCGDEAELTVGRTDLAGYEGGISYSTTWWPVGLADLHKPALVFPALGPVHKTTAEPQTWARAPMPRSDGKALTPPAPVARQHWSDVLGVERDASFRECTRAYRTELSRLNDLLIEQGDPEASAAIDRLKAAYHGAATAHDVQVTE